MSSSESDKIQVNKTNIFPMDLAPKIGNIALVKPSDGKGATVQTPQTFSQQGGQMRIVMPGQTTAGQIIQTHIMPQTMIKQVDASGRTQLTALPSRTLTQASIVTRSPTFSTFAPRGPVAATNISVPRGTTTLPIRAPTPPSNVSNITSTFNRGVAPPRTPSPAGTIISSGTTTWMTGAQPVPLIRANINQSPRARLVAQPIPASVNVSSSGITTISANIVSQQNQVAAVTTGQPTFVATVLPPRPQTATLVYSNSQQQFTSTQRLAVTTPITGQRQVRPIQLTNTRLPTQGINVRVSTANIANIRGPNIPVLAPTSVLSSLPNTVQGRPATLSTSNISSTLPATRIIQVQQQPQTGGPQVISTRQIAAANLMTLHPVIMNTATGTGTGRVSSTTKVQPSLTITHVGKLPASNTQQTNLALATNISQGATLTSGNLNQQITHQSTSSTPIGIVTSTNPINQGQQQHQIAQIVGINQQGGSHQIQIIGSQNVPASATVVPLTITSRGSNAFTASVTTIPSSSVSQIMRGNVNVMSTNNASTTVPIAKVVPQQQPSANDGHHQTTVSVNSGQTQNVFIHARSTNPIVSNASTGNTLPANASFLQAGGTFYYEPSSTGSGISNVLTLATSTVTSNLNQTQSQSTSIAPANPSCGLVTSVSYTPQASSFAVVPSSNRNIGQLQGAPLSSGQQNSQIQAVRFNPQLIVDNSQNSSGVTHQIITMQQVHTANSQNQVPVQQSTQQSQPSQQTHVQIPITSKTPVQSPRASILRKRDSEGILSVLPISAQIIKSVAKNLAPALMQMSTITDKDRERVPSPHSRPGSSEGSTTVSATSSPNCDQQEMEENREMLKRSNIRGTELTFKAVDDMYPTVQPPHMFQQQNSTSSSSNGIEEASPKKKPRKQQLRNDNKTTSKNYMPAQLDNNTVSIAAEISKQHHIRSNKENSKPADIYIKKPRTCTLLDGYKQNWKAATNHFQRYSDVKPREERRPSVMDLANQANVSQTVNGWKIFHLTAQMEDLCDLESQVYSKLSTMLQCMEAHNQSVDVDRVNDLIKGNMQRSKIVTDGITDARSQILKIFDHKTPVSDIISRCASKRNFKKREKTI
ncbi:histone deacetylase complex subunit SAP130-A isoform X2 [Bradysia coprophila]|uniref:histone deacetylase complex subunit SAP130-A isoform X2 n=1 Tax=Bradysia coprophila TaxID=38358 RepID=UPI00187D8BC9|nr:histone deacetylase complex subunit SAP130-A isoform X2 [Bradysia coprophila]